MSLKFYEHRLKGHNEWFTIDPGCRQNGGTGLAFWERKTNTPIETKQFSSGVGGLHELKVEYALKNIEEYLAYFKYDVIPVFIEEPKFFESLKGLTAARSGSLKKLIFFYGRLFQLVHSLGLKPIPIDINHWKGQLSKTMLEKRIRKIFPHHTWKGDELDAVGIGLFLKGIIKWN